MKRTQYPTNGNVSKQARPANFRAIGITGLKQNSGYVWEEFLPQLRGERARRIYREMADNDATIGAFLAAIEMMIRAVDWKIVPADIEKQKDDLIVDVTRHEKSVQFVKGLLFEDMETPFDDFITEALSMLTYGWSWFEILYKRRIGPNETNPTRKSRFKDGKIGIRDLVIRSQDSLDRWEVNEETGEIVGMWQTPPAGGDHVFIPREKSLLFRPKSYRKSPESKSVLRPAYRPWYLLKHTQDIEVIAIERELNGLPIARVPQDLLASTDSDDLAIVAEYVKMVRDVKFNEQAGIVLPSDPWMDSEGKHSGLRQYEFELLSSKGSRAIDTNTVIERYQFDIARTVLADFIMLGVSERGSFALSETKVDLFLRSLEGWMEVITNVVNRDLLPGIWDLNGMNPNTMPKLESGRIAPDSLDEIGNYVARLQQGGFFIGSDPKLENHLRRVGGFPELTKEQQEENEEQQSPPQPSPVNPGTKPMRTRFPGLPQGDTPELNDV